LSIGQFYEVWHVLEKHGVDFASATQDFSTGTSQGKLMLNMLLSFAQYERELVSERTRDKIAAARKRGLMSGGMPALGYDFRDGRLVVNEHEAPLVREIFRIYLERQSLTGTIQELDLRGWTTKTWRTRNGSLREGRAFNKLTLFHLLRRPQYAGLVPHRGKLFPGQHEAIVDEAIWSRAQSLLRHNGATGGKEPRNKHAALLRGLLHCAVCGSAMNHTFTTKKGGTRYRYYRCATNEKRGAFACPGGSVSAHELERRIVERVRDIGKDPELVAEVVRQARTQMDDHRVLEAEQCQLGKDLKRERASVGRLARNGDSSARLAAVQEHVDTVQQRLASVAQDLETASAQTIDDRRVSAVLAAFDSVWDVLVPAERTRILGLLAERITYDGRNQALELAFRPGGIGRLHELQTC
jgi:site-specific DNA recombinase